MKLQSIALSVTALSMVATTNAHAICSSPEGPQAEAMSSGTQGGTRPWLRAFNVKDSDPIAMFTVDAKCKRDWSTPEKAKIACAAVKPIELDRNGRYLRPKASIAEGTHVQITTGKTLIGDFVIKRQATEAVKFDSIKVGRRTSQPLQGCQLKGTQVDLTVKRVAGDKTPYAFQNTMLLVYTKQPDPANPLTNLVYILSVGPGDTPESDGRTYLRDTSYEPKYVPTKFPAKIWVALSDEDDHVAPPVELSIK